ncbi:MAG: tyrosine-type recombinase/integrase, partial [Anaerolineales bacterium]|nr:tyrosine-type recombinase/integrase [Anaerolineales bacterium]
MKKKSSTWLTLKKAIEGFHLECNARGLSQHTIKNYMLTLNRFCEKMGDVKITEIQVSDIVDFLNVYSHLRNKSLLNMYVALSSFWSWLVRQSYVQENLLRRIPRPKAQIVAIQPFTELEIRAMLSSLGRNEDRNRAIILLLLDTGIRASELINLKRGDIDLQNRTIKVLGKGNKERIVPFSPRTATALFRV